MHTNAHVHVRGGEPGRSAATAAAADDDDWGGETAARATSARGWVGASHGISAKALEQHQSEAESPGAETQRAAEV